MDNGRLSQLVWVVLSNLWEVRKDQTSWIIKNSETVTRGFTYDEAVELSKFEGFRGVSLLDRNSLIIILGLQQITNLKN